MSDLPQDQPTNSDGGPGGNPLVSVVMGSTSDWDTMRHADETLTHFGVPHETLVVSAHRTPDWMAEFASA